VQGGYGRESATEMHRGRYWALRREWWAQMEAARRGKEKGAPREGRRGNVLACKD
jgi:hypothetical protein